MSILTVLKVFGVIELQQAARKSVSVSSAVLVMLPLRVYCRVAEVFVAVNSNTKYSQ